MANNIYKSISDVISISDIFIGRSNQVDRSFEDIIILTDTFTGEARDRFITEDIREESKELRISDIFSYDLNNRFIKNLVDGVGILDTFNYRIQAYPIEHLSGVINLSDIFTYIHRIAPIKNLSDTINLTGFITLIEVDKYGLIINNIVQISDDINVRINVKTIVPPEELVSVVDVFNQQWGIIVNGGTGSGSYNLNDVVQLGATVPTGFTFLKWNFSKVGINNIYDPDATVTVPYGGGVITAEFVKTDSLVTIYDIFDFEYINNKDINDEIHTNETASPTTGGFMGVANHDFEIPQGARFHNIMIYRDANGDPVDLTGYTAEMQIRKYKAASDPSVLTLNTSNGYLALGGAAGTITIDTPGNITDSLDFKWGYYDLELYPAGDSNNTVRILEGRIELSKQVTR